MGTGLRERASTIELDVLSNIRSFRNDDIALYTDTIGIFNLGNGGYILNGYSKGEIQYSSKLKGGGKPTLQPCENNKLGYITVAVGDNEFRAMPTGEEIACETTLLTDYNKHNNYFRELHQASLSDSIIPK